MFGAGVFVARSGYGDGVLVSSDGWSWVRVAIGPDVTCLHYANGYFWAGCMDPYTGNYKKTIRRSANGTAWETVAQPNWDSSIAAIAFGGNIYAALDCMSARCTSSNGSPGSWASVPFPEFVTRSDRALAYGNGRFVAKGHDYMTNRFLLTVSDDGQAWRVMARASFVFGDMIFASGRFRAVGKAILSSPNGEAWAEEPLPPGVTDLQGLCVANDKLVAVGRDKLIYRKL